MAVWDLLPSVGIFDIAAERQGAGYRVVVKKSMVRKYFEKDGEDKV